MHLARFANLPIFITLLGVCACRPTPLLQQNHEVLPETLRQQVITLAMLVPDGHVRRVDGWLVGPGAQHIEIRLFPTGIVQERGYRPYWAKERLDPPEMEFRRSHRVSPAVQEQALGLLARIAPDRDGESSARGCSMPIDGPGALINVRFQLAKDQGRSFLLFPDCETRAGLEAKEVARQAIRSLTGARYLHATLFQD